MAEHPFAKHLKSEEEAENTPPPAATTPTPTEVSSTPLPVQPSTEHPFTISKKKLKNRYLIIGIASLTLVIGSLGYYIISRSKGGILVELNNRQGITITLNDRKVNPRTSSKGLYIPAYPGQYRLVINKEDYIPFVQDILLGKGEEIVIRPAFALLPKQEESEGATTVDYLRPSSDQKALFYLGNNRQIIYRMEIGNRIPIPLTDQPLRSVSDIQWSGEPNVALITQNDGVYLQEIPKYDFQHQTLVKVGGKEIISPIWDPNDSERIACIYSPNTGEYSLVFTSKSFKKFDRKLTDLAFIKNPKLIWSADSSQILLLARSENSNDNNIWVYTTADGTLSQLTQSGNIIDASFSPSSNTILYESFDPEKPESATPALTIMNSDGSNKQALDIVGKVAQAAWKTDNSFFFPDLRRKNLTLYTINGKKQDLGFTFPDPQAVQGMYYSSVNKTLIFSTTDSIFTVNLGL